MLAPKVPIISRVLEIRHNPSPALPGRVPARSRGTRSEGTPPGHSLPKRPLARWGEKGVKSRARRKVQPSPFSLALLPPPHSAFLPPPQPQCHMNLYSRRGRGVCSQAHPKAALPNHQSLLTAPLPPPALVCQQPLWALSPLRHRQVLGSTALRPLCGSEMLRCSAEPRGCSRPPLRGACGRHRSRFFCSTAPVCVFVPFLSGHRASCRSQSSALVWCWQMQSFGMSWKGSKVHLKGESDWKREQNKREICLRALSVCCLCCGIESMTHHCQSLCIKQWSQSFWCRRKANLMM